MLANTNVNSFLFKVFVICNVKVTLGSDLIVLIKSKFNNTKWVGLLILCDNNLGANIQNVKTYKQFNI